MSKIAHFLRVNQDGVSLIEVLVSLAILSAAIIPMIDLTVLVSGVTPFQRQIALTLAIEKAEELGNLTYRMGAGARPGDSPEDEPPVTVGRYQFDRRWVVSQYAPGGLDDFTPEKNKMWTIVTTVTCTNCGKINPRVRLVTTVDKL